MAERRVNPEDGVGRADMGAVNGGFAVAHAHAVAAEEKEAL
jgi:hypothetical protein